MVEHDEDRDAERAAILRRRAQLVACALMTGVATSQAACACLRPGAPEQGTGAVAGSYVNACLSGAGSDDYGGAPTGENLGGAGAGGIRIETGGSPSAESGGAAPVAGGEGGRGFSICLSVK